jgi:ribonuclease HI
MSPAAVYSDGGVVGRNPSALGGTWAWVHTDGRGYGREESAVAEASGFVAPADLGLAAVSNNATELLALTLALEAVPPGWDGAAYSDSNVTLCRFRSARSKMAGVPPALVERVRRLQATLGPVRYYLLGGHPNRKELAAGIRADGMSVSKFNVRCDDLCRAEARAARAKGGSPQ